MKINSIDDAVKTINDIFLKNKEQILASGKSFSGIPVNKLEKRLMAQIGRYKSDPFLPAEIRKKIIDLLENRFNTFHSIYIDTLTNYMNNLAKGEHVDTLDSNHGWVHNEMNSQLYERGCGISQIEEAVHEIRYDIQRYLEKFNPLKNA